MDHDNLENVDFQMRKHGGVNIEGNDPIEEDHNDEGDHDDQDDHNDQDDDDDDDDDDDIDANLDVPMLEKVHKPLYEGSQTTLLATVLLLVNLKVMNSLSNIAMTHILRYVIIFHFFSCNFIKINIG